MHKYVSKNFLLVGLSRDKKLFFKGLVLYRSKVWFNDWGPLLNRICDILTNMLDYYELLFGWVIILQYTKIFFTAFFMNYPKSTGFICVACIFRVKTLLLDSYNFFINCLYYAYISLSFIIYYQRTAFKVKCKNSICFT